ncbi:MAG: hypothetical protein ABGW81_07970 [Paracoccaceae bacterium]
MGQIHHICRAYAVGAGMDHEVIRNLKKSVGMAKYEEIAERAAFQLADRLGRLDRALPEADLTMCYRHALHICGAASQIWLVEVSKVAAGVMRCARAENNLALVAVIGRLNPVAEAPLFSVFDLEE